MFIDSKEVNYFFSLISNLPGVLIVKQRRSKRPEVARRRSESPNLPVVSAAQVRMFFMDWFVVFPPSLRGIRCQQWWGGCRDEESSCTTLTGGLLPALHY